MTMEVSQKAVMDVSLSLIKIGERARKDLKPSEMVKIARAIEEEIKAESHAFARAKAEWIAKARVSFQPSDRQSCHVCGQFKGVAQAHHVAPLGIQYDMGVRHAIQDFVWLCPTHHAIAHAVISEHAKGEHTPFIDGVPAEDLNVIEKISKRGFDLILSALSFERGAE